MESKDIIAITVLFLIGFYLYSLPVQTNRFPFGEGDAAHKYGMADWMYTQDSAPRDMPFFYATWYPWIIKNDFYAPANPAPYYVSMAATHIVAGGDRFTAPDIFLALTSLGLASITVYFLIRKLYGFWTGFLASVLLLFPIQNMMAYLWGQRPHLIALAYVPLVIYCYHKYVISEKNSGIKYLVLASVFAAVAAVIYLQVLLLIAAFVLIYSIAILIKEKRLAFNWKHVILAAAIIALVLGPFVPDIAKGYASQTKSLGINNLSHLFYWFKPAADMPNQFMYDYSQALGGIWSLPFLFLGIFFIIYRRSKEDLVVLSWLAAMYIVIHLDVTGLMDQGRTARLIFGSALVFYPIISVAFMGIPRLIPLSKGQKPILRLALIAVFLILTAIFAAKPAYETMKNAYPDMLRMTPYQYEAAKWLNQNIPENSVVYAQGQLTYAKMRWIHMFSQRALTGFNRNMSQASEEVKDFPVTNHLTHALLDYSDYMILGDKANIEKLKGIEKTIKGTLIYDQDNIKVFELAEQ
ncbi:MAG: 6-pyruvoyl-tetrahydropterin synthase-related protein [Candidatus Woesearchaeota archaeon]